METKIASFASPSTLMSGSLCGVKEKENSAIVSVKEPSGPEECTRVIKIVLIDDQELIRYGLRLMLEQENDMQVLGDYPNMSQAFSEIERLSPDVVLVDVHHMMQMRDTKAASSLKLSSIGYKVIVLAETEEYRKEVIDAGADDYLLKSMTCREFTGAIRRVVSGNMSGMRKPSTENLIEIIMPPSTAASSLIRFVCQLEDRLNDKYLFRCASIVEMTGSWGESTILRVLVVDSALTDVLGRLAEIPEVERIEDEPSFKCSLPGQSGYAKELGICPSRRIYLTLRQVQGSVVKALR